MCNNFHFSIFNIILVDTLLDWGITEKVVFILTDNANNMTAAMECLNELYVKHKIKHQIDNYGCLCHTLSLVLKHSVLNDKDFSYLSS